jgi:hypothetical protein
MEKNAIFGIILIIISLVIILYANAGIANEQNLTMRRQAGTQVQHSAAPSLDDWKDVPILKTVRFVGFVIGGTGFLLLVAGLFRQPRKARRRGAIYID